MSQILKTGLKNKTRINYRTTVIFRLNLFLGFIRTPAQAKLTFQTRISGRSKKKLLINKNDRIYINLLALFWDNFQRHVHYSKRASPWFYSKHDKRETTFFKAFKGCRKKIKSNNEIQLHQIQTKCVISKERRVIIESNPVRKNARGFLPAFSFYKSSLLVLHKEISSFINDANFQQKRFLSFDSKPLRNKYKAKQQVIFLPNG